MKDDEAVSGILQFWFNGIEDGFDVGGQTDLWFKGSEAVDREIRQRFGGLVESALAGELSHWQQHRDSALALVILLDQFTRNIYRGSADAFAGDARARGVVEMALERSFDRRLGFVRRTFLYMPLMHSETLSDQQRCVTLFEALLSEVPAEGKPMISSNLKFARQHRQLIEQYGRFPHRNAALGRPSTAAEIAYLEGGGARFGQ